MNKWLKNKLLYLSGPIQYNVDAAWRVGPTQVLRDRFNINVFDPHADPKQQWLAQLLEAQQQCNYDEMSRIAKRFVRKDLQKVQRTDIVVAYLPHGVPTTGTVHEIINSWANKNPTLLVSEKKEKIPLWYYGFIDHKYMFGGFDALYAYLQEVDDGLHQDDWRWAMIYDAI